MMLIQMLIIFEGIQKKPEVERKKLGEKTTLGDIFSHLQKPHRRTSRDDGVLHLVFVV